MISSLFQLPTQVDTNAAVIVSVGALLSNLALGLLFAGILSWTVRKFGRVTTDKSQYTVIFMTLVPTMILIISIIKHSFALSLGLVGALSIVRFRTPIKEAEELVYLFLAIAVGLGLGADQILPTTLCFAVVVLVLIALSFVHRHTSLRGLFLDVHAPRHADQPAATVKGLSDALDVAKVGYELKRFADGRDAVQATFFLQAERTQDLEAVVSIMKQRFIDSEVTLIDGSRQLN